MEEGGLLGSAESLDGAEARVGLSGESEDGRAGGGAKRGVARRDGEKEEQGQEGGEEATAVGGGLRPPLGLTLV